jgi:hypothetical protein
VGYKVFHGSTLVAVYIKPPLIDALTGAPGMAFPHIRLKSGIAHCSVTGLFHQTSPSLGILQRPRVFIAAFNKENLPQSHGKVNIFCAPETYRKQEFNIAMGVFFCYDGERKEDYYAECL